MSISAEIIRLQQAKSDLATSIINKGITVPAATTLDEYAALVDQIQQGGGSLPYDAEIEYLQFTGTQYINLGYCQNNRNMEVRIRMQWTGNTTNQFESFFGYMTNGGTSPRSGLHKYQGKWMFGTNATQSTNNIDTSVHDFFISGDASTNKEKLYTEAGLLGTATTTSTGLVTNTIPYFIGCRNRDGSVDNYANFKLISFRLFAFDGTEHNNITHEMNIIPVRVGQVGYMYDKESGELFCNSGTGSFTLGPDVT